MKRTRYTEEQLREIVSQSISVAEVLRGLKLIAAGGNYSTVQARIRAFGISTDHFLGTRTNSGARHKGGTVPLQADDILVLREHRFRRVVLHRALQEKSVPELCSQCGMGPEWKGKPLQLHIDHIDGDYRNNVLSNLHYLCPNCHSQSETYCGRNKGKSKGSVKNRET